MVCAQAAQKTPRNERVCFPSTMRQRLSLTHAAAVDLTPPCVRSQFSDVTWLNLKKKRKAVAHGAERCVEYLNGGEGGQPAGKTSVFPPASGPLAGAVGPEVVGEVLGLAHRFSQVHTVDAAH